MIALFGLVGCVQLAQPAPQVREYRLDYASPVVEGRPLPATIRVAPFGVTTVYDRQAIVYRDSTYATGAFVHARWSTNPGSMVADLLARDLAISGLYRAVQQGPSILPSDYQLSAHIEQIEERAGDDGCSAQLRLRALLLRSRAAESDPVVLRNSYAESEPCPCNDAAGLAAALSQALQRLSSRLQHDVYEAIESTMKRTQR
jgi:ABC-type uncharacterized transport system auxiliary subunit